MIAAFKRETPRVTFVTVFIRAWPSVVELLIDQTQRVDQAAIASATDHVMFGFSMSALRSRSSAHQYSRHGWVGLAPRSTENPVHTITTLNGPGLVARNPLVAADMPADQGRPRECNPIGEVVEVATRHRDDIVAHVPIEERQVRHWEQHVFRIVQH